MNTSPVIVFLVPLAPRRVKSNWQATCRQLEQTLKSIRNSDDGDFRVVIAGNDKPDFDAALDGRFEFLSIDEKPPLHSIPVVAGVLDKLEKVTAAWEHAKAKWNPQHVMKLDADDFISCRLVGWLEENKGKPGYLIPHGWSWKTGARFLIQRTETLDRECGSCIIIRHDLVEHTGPFLTETEGVVMSEASSKFAVDDQYSLVPGSGVSTLLGNDSHQRYAAQFAYLGHDLASVPFPAVIYRTGNPDSNSKAVGNRVMRRTDYTVRMRLGALRRKRIITRRIQDEFALP